MFKSARNTDKRKRGKIVNSVIMVIPHWLFNRKWNLSKWNCDDNSVLKIINVYVASMWDILYHFFIEIYSRKKCYFLRIYKSNKNANVYPTTITYIECYSKLKRQHFLILRHFFFLNKIHQRTIVIVIIAQICSSGTRYTFFFVYKLRAQWSLIL